MAAAQTAVTADACCPYYFGGGVLMEGILSTKDDSQAAQENSAKAILYGEGAGDARSIHYGKELMAQMFRIIPGGVIGRYYEEGFPLYMINDTLLRSLGYTYEELRRATEGYTARLIHPEDRESAEEEIRSRIEREGEYSLEYRLLKKSGEEMWVHDQGCRIEGNVILSVVTDISERIVAEERLRAEASQDPLTGVSNQRGARRQMEEAFRRDEEGFLLVMDIDNFKAVNDSFGHLAGDHVLIRLATILRNCSRKQDVVARIGGDEFLVYYTGMEQRETAEKKAALIRQQYEAFMGENYPKLRTSVSIGIARHRKEQPIGLFLQQADRAMYEEKRRKKGKKA